MFDCLTLDDCRNGIVHVEILVNHVTVTVLAVVREVVHLNALAYFGDAIRVIHC